MTMLWFLCCLFVLRAASQEYDYKSYPWTQAPGHTPGYPEPITTNYYMGVDYNSHPQTQAPGHSPRNPEPITTNYYMGVASNTMAPAPPLGNVLERTDPYHNSIDMTYQYPAMTHSPRTTIHEESSVSHMPGMPIHEESSVSHMPGTTIHEESSVSHMPGMPIHEESSVSHMPGTTIHEESSVSHMPGMPIHEESSVSHMPGTTIHEESSVSHMPGTTIHEESSVSNIPGTTIHEESSVSHFPGTTIHEESSVSHMPRTTIHEESSVSHMPGTAIHEETSVSHMPGTTIHEESNVSHMPNYGHQVMPDLEGGAESKMSHPDLNEMTDVHKPLAPEEMHSLNSVSTLINGTTHIRAKSLIFPITTGHSNNETDREISIVITILDEPTVIKFTPSHFLVPHESFYVAETTPETASEGSEVEHPSVIDIQTHIINNISNEINSFSSRVDVSSCTGGFAAANNEVSIILYSFMVKEDENLAISPLFVTHMAYILLMAAEGETMDDIVKTFRFKINNAVHVNYLFSAPEEGVRNDLGVTFAEKIFYEQSFAHDNESLLLSLGNTYQGIDLKTNSQKALEIINDAVSNSSRGTIPGIIDSPPNTDEQMIVVTSGYVKGLWKIPFPPAETKLRNFYKKDGTLLRKVEMMHLQNVTLRFLEDKTLKIKFLELDYIPQSYRKMWILLPAKNLPYKYYPLTMSNICTINSSLVLTRMEAVLLPKFRIDYSSELSELLKDMGMKQPFKEHEANFAKLGNGLHIDEFLHRAVVDVDEGYHEDVNSTYDSSDSYDLPTASFIAHRPFSFLIINDISGEVMFSGKVGNPHY